MGGPQPLTAGAAQHSAPPPTAQEHQPNPRGVNSTQAFIAPLPGSPRARRKGPEESRGAGSPSPPLLAETPQRRPSFGTCLSPAYGLGCPAVPSPRQSPRTPRKPLGDPRPPAGPRERKNSITEISDNEDELLEYHRRQRQERVREQEMERLVRPGAGGPRSSTGRPLCKCFSAFAALKPGPCLLGICRSCQAAGLSGGITARSSRRCPAALRENKAPGSQQPGVGMAPRGCWLKRWCPRLSETLHVSSSPAMAASAGDGAAALWAPRLYLGWMGFLWSQQLPGWGLPCASTGAGGRVAGALFAQP